MLVSGSIVPALQLAVAHTETIFSCSSCSRNLSEPLRWIRIRIRILSDPTLGKKIAIFPSVPSREVTNLFYSVNSSGYGDPDPKFLTL
jgi:hypothetical protein